MTTTARPSKRGSAILWTGAALLMLAPAVAMRFTAEVHWTLSDFLVFAAMLAAAGGAYEFLSRRPGRWTYRAAAAIAVFAAFLLVWVNLAVGIIGSERTNANLMYAGVLAAAVGGSIVARFRARGMAAAMIVAAMLQVLIAAVAIALGLGSEGPIWPSDVLGATAILSTLWLASGWLFRRAALHRS